MFTKQKGVRIATWTNITEKLEDPNQMTASIAQPTEGKEFKNGLTLS